MASLKVFVAPLHEGVRIPTKRPEDGCYDIYADFPGDFLVIRPLDIVSVPTGLVTAWPSGYRFELRERGNTGIRAMAIRAGQIDSGYRYEWFVLVNNTSLRPIIITKKVDQYFDMYGNFVGDPALSECVTIYPYTKAICQAALEIVPDAEIVPTTLDAVVSIASERGEGRLGSSGK